MSIPGRLRQSRQRFQSTVTRVSETSVFQSVSTKKYSVNRFLFCLSVSYLPMFPFQLSFVICHPSIVIRTLGSLCFSVKVFKKFFNFFQRHFYLYPHEHSIFSSPKKSKY